jgi:hypothetical protein
MWDDAMKIAAQDNYTGLGCNKNSKRLYRYRKKPATFNRSGQKF